MQIMTFRLVGRMLIRFVSVGLVRLAISATAATPQTTAPFPMVVNTPVEQPVAVPAEHSDEAPGPGPGWG